MTQILIELEDGTRRVVPEDLLERTDVNLEDDNEITTAVEYRFPGSDRIVHRSCHVTLKKWPEGMGAVVAELGK